MQSALCCDYFLTGSVHTARYKCGTAWHPCDLSCTMYAGHCALFLQRIYPPFSLPEIKIYTVSTSALFGVVLFVVLITAVRGCKTTVCISFDSQGNVWKTSEHSSKNIIGYCMYRDSENVFLFWNKKRV